MAQSYVHAEASARHFGGRWEDYIAIHEKIDSMKSMVGNVRHRAFFHNTAGPWLMQEIFGRYIVPTNEDGSSLLNKTGHEVRVSVRDIAENHIVEDLGCIPSPDDYMCNMTCKVWMSGKRNKFIGREELLETEVKIPNLDRGDEK